MSAAFRKRSGSGTHVLGYSMSLRRLMPRKLGAFDSAGVALVDDRAVCGRASRALGEVPAGPDLAGRRRPRYSDVVVVRLGQSGYMVHAFWHQFGNGHYYCDRVLMDARFRNVKYLCS
jgi:hypothetical protein